MISHDDRTSRGWTWLAVACVLAGGFFLYRWYAQASVHSESDSNGVAQATAPGRIDRPTRAIETIRVGDRVIAEHPTNEEDSTLGVQVDPATWRKLELRVRKRDGSLGEITVLRPIEWITETDCRPGGTVALSIPECGIEDDADIISIEPCPPIRSGSGRVVTGTYRHTSAAIVDLHVSGQDEPIGTTANHKFWSEDRQNFVRADELKPGECLRGIHGPLIVEKLVARQAPEPAFNLEVQGAHVYHVSTGGILVHNANPKNTIKPFPDSWNLGLGKNGVVYEIEGTLNGNKMNYVGSTHDSRRLLDPNHPANELLRNGKNITIKSRLVDISDAKEFTNKGVSEERAAKRILRTQEQLSLDEMLERTGGKLNGTRNGHTNLNAISARAANKMDGEDGDHRKYGDRRHGKPIDATDLVECP